MTKKIQHIFKNEEEELSLNNFTVLKLLGSGGFGSCYKATYNGEEICLKKINRTSKKKAALQSFRAETKNEFYSFNHPNIVKLLTASQRVRLDDESIISDLFMAFELIEGRNLQIFIDNTNNIIDTFLMVKFSIEIASALDYVHSYGIAHLDVKPGNVMVTNDGICKLADFGCSQYIDDEPLSAEQSCLTGTCAYRAPELLHGGGRPTSKCDVYSLGICLWQIWSREFPFAGINQHEVIFRVVRQNLRPVFYEDRPVDNTYKQVATKCWEEKPDDRPSITDIINALSQLNINRLQS